jgi:hypothetical protein
MANIARARGNRSSLATIGHRTAHGIVVIAAVLAAACGGSDGGDVAPAPVVINNLTAKAVQVLSATPTIGYPMDVSATIASTVAKDEVSVTLYAIGKDVPDEQRRQIPLGTRTIARVEAGEGAYRLTYDIPTNVEGMAYYIGMIVNAAGNVEDSNPDDNTATTVAALAQPPTPNIFIQETSLDGKVIPLDTRSYEEQVAAENGVHNADAGVTIYVGSQGAKAPVALQGYARLRMTRSDTGATHEVPVYLWDSEAQRYTNAFAINPPASEPEWLPLGTFTPQLAEQVAVGAEVDVATNELDRKSVHLDLYFPGKLASTFEFMVRHFLPAVGGPVLPPPDLTQADIDALQRFLANLPASTDPANPYDEGPAMKVLSISVCAQIRPVGFQDRDASDNEACTAVTLLLPPLPKPPPDNPDPPPPNYKDANPVLFNKAYNNRWGGRAFSVGVAFSGQATADNRGLIAGLNGNVPAVVFGQDLKFVEANVRAQVLPKFLGAPTGQTPGVQMDLRILGVMIDSIDEPSYTKTGTLGAVSKKWEKSKTFTVGPVPVTVSGFLMGEAGIKYELGVAGTALFMQGGPYAQADAGASGGVGLPGFGAGVEGSLTLIREEFTIGTAATLTVVDDGFTSQRAHLVLVPSLRIANVVTGPTGYVCLYAEYSYPTIRKCSWGLFTGVCPTIRRAKERLVLDRFRTFQMSDTLLNVEGNIILYSYSSGPPSYYTTL